MLLFWTKGGETEEGGRLRKSSSLLAVALADAYLIWLPQSWPIL